MITNAPNRPTKTLSDANETVAKGFYNATTLSTVDSDLAPANIKNGITIFGKAGSASVLDVSDADAGTADVKDPKTFYSVTGPRKTGTMPTVAIVAANDNYPEGYHAGNAGGLDAIDTDLASSNIKSGVTIFGKAGSTNVRDTTDADAVAADVLSPKTFYAGGGARKTGTMPTQSLNPANETVAAGYYAATTLSAVDADLAVGNIKTGVTIFGKLGTYDTTATPIAATRMKTGDEGWANGSKITGTGTKTLSPASETVAAGYYAATTLSAVDGDLAVGNIKSGVTIFGKLGTYVSSLTQDIIGSAKTSLTSGAIAGCYYINLSVGGLTEVTLATKTQSYTAGSLAVATGFFTGQAGNPDCHKLGLYMGGVQVVETAFLPVATDTYILMFTSALSGSKECKLTDYNYNASARSLFISGGLSSGDPTAAAVAIGSIKAT